jgi:hypothetical protein
MLVVQKHMGMRGLGRPSGAANERCVARARPSPPHPGPGPSTPDPRPPSSPIHPPLITRAQASDILETVDVSGDGGILKLITKRGDGQVPAKGASISAHYTGKLVDGKKFDSSRDRNSPFSFPLGQGRVIQGWDKSFGTMAVGERAILVLSPDYAYGSRGAGGSIPGGATLYFDVELLSFKGAAREL